MAFVYIIESITKDKYYVGSTVDLRKRMQHHKNGHTATTKRFGEIKLAFYQEYPHLKDARSIEKKLKRLRRKDYLEKIIKDGVIKMQP